MTAMGLENVGCDVQLDTLVLALPVDRLSWERAADAYSTRLIAAIRQACLDFIAGAEGYRGQAHYRDGPQAVRSGRIVTAPGSAPITFTAEIYRALGFGSEELDTYVQILGAEHQPKAA